MGRILAGDCEPVRIRRSVLEDTIDIRDLVEGSSRRHRILALRAFSVCSMPEKSNLKEWKDDWLGARVYWRTKIWLRADERGEGALPDRLTGQWKAPGGFSFSIARDGIRIDSPGQETVWNARTCRYRFQMEYDFTFRSALDRPEGGLAFRTFARTGATPALRLPDRRFPRLSCSCDSNFATGILVDIDRLMMFDESDRVLPARRN